MTNPASPKWVILHPTEQALAQREVSWDYERALPAIPPGATSEQVALELIDAQRHEEQREQRRQAQGRKQVRL